MVLGPVEVRRRLRVLYFQTLLSLIHLFFFIHVLHRTLLNVVHSQLLLLSLLSLSLTVPSLFNCNIIIQLVHVVIVEKLIIILCVYEVFVLILVFKLALFLVFVRVDLQMITLRSRVLL